MTLGSVVLGQAETQANVLPPPPHHQGSPDLGLWRECYQEAFDGGGHTKYEWASWRYLERIRGAPCDVFRFPVNSQGFPGVFQKWWESF